MIALAMTMIVAPTTGFIALTVLAEQKRQVTLTAMLDDLGNIGNWDDIIKPALQELRLKHPDMDIKIKLTTTPYNQTRSHILNALSNRTAVDIISLDQIWLGDFASRGFLTDITDHALRWGRLSDWYQTNFDGGVYKGKIYGIWAWTDIRGIWYWKDLLKEAAVEPDSLTSWGGYIASAKKLDDTLRSKGIEGVHLDDSTNSMDKWYPYLWMLGGDILVQKEGHPTKGTYWFPAYNSSAGVKALEFLKQQVQAGIKPQSHMFETAFAKEKKFAVIITGSWMPGEFPRDQWSNLPNKIGFLPLFPLASDAIHNSTMMGGWELSIPHTSNNKDLAWELMTLMVEPKILAPWLKQYGYLPTQKSIGQGQFAASLNQTIPYYDKMISMISFGSSRPSLPEYPQVADNIREAIHEVYFNIKDPKHALEDAAKKSAKALGW
jgi:multiple sugar transport system substrate-binding protein